MPYNKLTKIIATIGPASESEEMIKKLIENGVNIFRFNLKHNDLEWHREKIILVKEIAQEINVPIGVLIDLQGPEVRLLTPNTEDILIQNGMEITIKADSQEDEFRVTDNLILASVNEGDNIVVDDGKFSFKVVRKGNEKLVIKSHSEGLLKNRKTINTPGIYSPIASLTKRDKDAIEMFSDLQVDFMALSFVRNAQDVFDLKEFLKKKEITSRIISKMETKLAIDNIDEIIDASEGIMVARGDLGVEIPLEQVPYYQKIMIKKCLERGFPVITATQMIQSMIDRPYPTRAEISDIANASYDMTDMVMLSEESAAGNYPAEAVAVMSKTTAFNEQRVMVKDTRTIFNYNIMDTEEMLCDTAYNFYLQLKKKDYSFGGFIVFTETGRTARKLSRYRAKAPIYVFAPTRRVRDTLTANYGITPILQQKIFKKGKIIRVEDMQNAILHLEEMGYFDKKKHYILLFGDNWMVEGKVSTIKVISPTE